MMFVLAVRLRGKYIYGSSNQRTKDGWRKTDDVHRFFCVLRVDSDWRMLWYSLQQR